MPLDHYVSQVHLKQFVSPRLGDRFHAIRKRDLFYFEPNAKSVCRIEGGSTNYYLSEERAIEEFLSAIEPKYNVALQNLYDNSIDRESIYVVAGFAAYVLTCSPAAMRHQSTAVQHTVEATAKMLDAKGLLPRAPKELGSKTMSELIEGGQINVEIDPKYPQAIGVTTVLQLTHAFGNGNWEILINPNSDSPFFTSDFPVATVRVDSGISIRLIPLSPTVAVSIYPKITTLSDTLDFSFKDHRNRTRRLSRREAIEINRMLVRAAESEVYYCDPQPWIPGFVKKNATYRTEVIANRIPHGSGTIIHTRTEVRPYHAPTKPQPST